MRIFNQMFFAVVAVLVGCMVACAPVSTSNESIQQEVVHKIVEPTPIPVPEEKRPSLVVTLPPIDEYVDIVFDDCSNKKMSPAMRAIHKKRLLRFVENGQLKGLGQYDFVSIPCLETAMGSAIKHVSSAGALGFAQLMPATARAEAKLMGLGELNDGDLQDVELNLTLAVHHYARLMEEIGPEFAAAAYNGGSAAGSVKDLQNLRPPRNLETAGYVSVAYVILRKHMKEANATLNLPKTASAR